MNLIDEILKRGATQDGSVTELLKLARIAASKLGTQEVEKWIGQELAGYGGNCMEDLPEYRRLRGRLEAFNPYRGWQPVIYNDDASNDAVSQAHVSQSLGSLEETYSNSPNQNAELLLSPKMRSLLINSLKIKTDVRLIISETQIFSIIDTVKNRVFDWAIELNRAGVSGVDFGFSQDEIRAAAPVTQHFHFGDRTTIGAVGYAGQDLSGQVASNFDLAEVSEFLVQVIANAKSIPGSEGAEIEELSLETKAAIDRGTVSVEEIRSRLVRIREIAENVIGNLVAGGIVVGASALIS